MTYDEALALYNAGPKVVAKILCDLSNTIESLQEQIKVSEYVNENETHDLRN